MKFLRELFLYGNLDWEFIYFDDFKVGSWFCDVCRGGGERVMFVFFLGRI